MKTTNPSHRPISGNYGELFALIICILTLTACPEIKQVNQPIYAYPGDTILVSFEFIYDSTEWDKSGYLEATLPKSWIALDSAHLSNDSLDIAVPVLEIESDWDDIKDFDGFSYWRAGYNTILHRNPSFGQLWVIVGSESGSYITQYELADPYWGTGFRTEEIDIHILDSNIQPWNLSADGSTISWSAPIKEQGLLGYSIYRDGYLLKFNHADTFFVADEASKGLNSYLISSLYTSYQGAFCPYDVKVLHGDTIYVSPQGNDSWNGGTPENAMKTINHAMSFLDADKNNPKFIKLLPGVYGPSGNGENLPIVIKDYVDILGDVHNETVIDAEHQSHVIIVRGTTNTIAHLSILNSASEYFSPIDISNSWDYVLDDYISIPSNVTLNNVILKDNQTEESALRAYDSFIKLQNVIIADNRSGVNLTNCDAEIINCTITNNSGNGTQIRTRLGGKTIRIKNSIINDEKVEMVFGPNSDQYISYSYINTDVEADNRIEEEIEFVSNEHAFYQLEPSSGGIDEGDPDQEYNDKHEEESPNMAKYPSLQTIRNDIGAYGGPLAFEKEMTYTIENIQKPYVNGERDRIIQETNFWNSFYFGSNEEQQWFLSGPDVEQFNVKTRERSIRLHFNVEPDYENPSDANGDNVYELYLTVENELGYKTEFPITITVTDYDERAPLITGLSEITHPHHELDVHKYESNKIVNWHLHGEDAYHFVINKDGQLKFNIFPDFDNPVDSNSDNIYEVKVVASDEKYESDQMEVQIEVVKPDPIILSVEKDHALDVRVYPNPARERIFIDHPKQDRLVEVRLISLSGQQLKSAYNIYDRSIDLAGLSPGVYVLHASFESYELTRRIIKEP